jgi:pyridoxine/pyridoxamine 5'-phosphate oxidase
VDNKQVIYDFLKGQIHMVISTTNKDGNPEAALVGFAQAEDLSLIFGTYTTTRKYTNIVTNPHVAIVFGNQERITVQYEGIASVLTGEELHTYKSVYFAKNPSSQRYEHHEHQIYLKVVPKWIRYTNFNKQPAEIFEITF